MRGLVFTTEDAGDEILVQGLSEAENPNVVHFNTSECREGFFELNQEEALRLAEFLLKCVRRAE